MRHKPEQARIIIATHIKAGIILAYESCDSIKCGRRESVNHPAKHQLGNNAHGHCMAVRHRTPSFRRKLLESMTESVAEIQSLARPFLRRVGRDYKLLTRYAFAHHVEQSSDMYVRHFRQCPCSGIRAAQQCVFEHFRIARQQFLLRQRSKKTGRYYC